MRRRYHVRHGSGAIVVGVVSVVSVVGVVDVVNVVGVLGVARIAMNNIAISDPRAN